MSDRPPFDDSLRQSDREVQQISAHFLHCVQTQSPSQVLDNFRRLFIEGREYQDAQVRAALEKIVISKQADREFQRVLYQCCQILIDRWYKQAESQPAIVELVELFENLPSSLISGTRRSSRWLQLVKSFRQSEHYLRLKRLLGAIAPSPDSKVSNSQCLGDLLSRYPFLYKHCLLDEDCTIDYQRTVRKICSRNQRNYEVALAQYVTYRVRLLQIARARQLLLGAGKLLRPVENPTLLSGEELKIALRQFSSKGHNSPATQNLSLEFLTQQNQIPSYKTFKDNLYQYLISILDSEPRKNKFNKQLHEKLQSILPDCNSQKLSEFLILRTYTQLFNFLVVESSQNLNHQILTDLMTNLGTTQASIFLFKLVILYPKIKPHLESRFSLLFEHYEFFSQEKISWFIKVLENFQIAFSFHFGTLDLSGLKPYNSSK
jgi:hypothetical protein